MGRLILGIVAGIVVAFATVLAVDFAGHQIYPLPAGLDLDDPQAVGAFIAAMPAAARMLVLAAFFAGALGGGVAAAAVSRREWAAWPVAGLVVAAGAAKLLMVPHPVLLRALTLAAPLLGGVAASLVARRMARNGR
ncbi:MAG TPA: hypothetical protein VF759_04795 [Allosphingosinicella sp.]|jgi:hypothetical protein